MALITHRPALDDPVLALMETVAGLGASGDGAWEILEQASRIPDRELRARAARAADDALVNQAVLIPIVRLYATLVADARLIGVAPGGSGTLLLERAGWAP
jgi:ABC-type oligopeptide transport system substrate-binding subunit